MPDESIPNDGCQLELELVDGMKLRGTYSFQDELFMYLISVAEGRRSFEAISKSSIKQQTVINQTSRYSNKWSLIVPNSMDKSQECLRLIREARRKKGTTFHFDRLVTELQKLFHDKVIMDGTTIRVYEYTIAPPYDKAIREEGRGESSVAVARMINDKLMEVRQELGLNEA